MEALPSAAVADAIVRLGLAIRPGPPGLRRAGAGAPLAGRALACRHSGSVDVFLEALTQAEPGDILVIDNEGREDEACVGDLTALEARLAGIAGLVVWGRHRDGAELRELGIDVWSLGQTPFGPLGLRPTVGERIGRARIGDAEVISGDHVVADDDGVVFVAAADREAVLGEAMRIVERERAQAAAIGPGSSLRHQLRFDDYLRRRAIDPAFEFRQHLREVGGAIET